MAGQVGFDFFNTEDQSCALRWVLEHSNDMMSCADGLIGCSSSCHPTAILARSPRSLRLRLRAGNRISQGHLPSGSFHRSDPCPKSLV